MEIFTLQDFYTYTKGIVYLLMGGALVGVTLYWQFLMGGKEEKSDDSHHHHG